IITLSRTYGRKFDAFVSFWIREMTKSVGARSPDLTAVKHRQGVSLEQRHLTPATRYNSTPPDVQGPRVTICPDFDGRSRLSWRVSVHPWHPADDVPRPAMDDAAVRRVWNSRRIQCPVSLPAGSGRQWPERRIRSSDPNGVRLRPRARPGRSRPCGCGNR